MRVVEYSRKYNTVYGACMGGEKNQGTMMFSFMLLFSFPAAYSMYSSLGDVLHFFSHAAERHSSQVRYFNPVCLPYAPQLTKNIHTCSTSCQV